MWVMLSNVTGLADSQQGTLNEKKAQMQQKQG
jgi:hypothetical protein